MPADKGISSIEYQFTGKPAWTELAGSLLMAFRHLEPVVGGNPYTIKAISAHVPDAEKGQSVLVLSIEPPLKPAAKEELDRRVQFHARMATDSTLTITSTKVTTE